jgi:hypothetical protein
LIRHIIFAPFSNNLSSNHSKNEDNKKNNKQLTPHIFLICIARWLFYLTHIWFYYITPWLLNGGKCYVIGFDFVDCFEWLESMAAEWWSLLFIHTVIIRYCYQNRCQYLIIYNSID